LLAAQSAIVIKMTVPRVPTMAIILVRDGTWQAASAGFSQAKRTRADFAAFFDGLEYVEPGLVPLPQWRALAEPSQVIPM
jgi:S-adenosyl methyltransferase